MATPVLKNASEFIYQTPASARSRPENRKEHPCISCPRVPTFIFYFWKAEVLLVFRGRSGSLILFLKRRMLQVFNACSDDFNAPSKPCVHNSDYLA